MTPPPKKASILQVAATILFGLFAIGKKGTWQKDGTTVTMRQVIIGAIIGAIVLIAILITIVHLVTR